MPGSTEKQSAVFPLFDTLYQGTSNIKTPLTYEEKMTLCNDIKELDQEGFDLLYAIIRHFFLAKENGRFDLIPYSPKVHKSGYKFDTTFLPPRLLIMIRHFVAMHLKKLGEDKEISCALPGILSSSNEKQTMEKKPTGVKGH